MISSKITILIAVAVIAVFFITDCGTSTALDRSGPEKTEVLAKSFEIGDPAPAFELVKSDGARVTLDLLRGRPAVLVFWSVYCSKCKQETPELNRLAREYSPQGVEVIGINTGESPDEIKRGVESFGIEYPVAADKGRRVMQSFGAQGTPTIVFLDKEGTIRYYGNKLPADYAGRLEELK